MRQYRRHILWEIITIILFFCLAGLLVWGAVKINSVSIKSSDVTPVLYQEKSVPVESSGAIPDTNSNDEGMLDMEKGPTVINL